MGGLRRVGWDVVYLVGMFCLLKISIPPTAPFIFFLFLLLRLFSIAFSFLKLSIGLVSTHSCVWMDNSAFLWYFPHFPRRESGRWDIFDPTRYPGHTKADIGCSRNI